MKRFYAVMVASLLSLISMEVFAADTHAGFEAVCRISNTNSKGTGTVFAEVNGNYHILTNYHVVARANEVGVEFWRDGHLSRSVRGKVLWTSFLNNANRDMAVVAVPTSEFGNGPKPAIIPLAARGTTLTAGSTVTSVGCASGAWATAFEGHVLQARGPVYDFVPPPAGGRSGSALYTKDGKQIVGLIAWRAAGDTHGIAMTLEEIYRAFEGKGPTDVTVDSRGREIPLSWDFANEDGLVPVYMDSPSVVYEVPVCGGSGGEGGMGGVHMMPFNETAPTWVQMSDGTWVQCGPGGCSPGGGMAPFNGRLNPFDGRVSPFGDNSQQPQMPGPSRGNPYSGPSSGGGGSGTFPTYPGGGSVPSVPTAPVASNGVSKDDFDSLAGRVSTIEQNMVRKTDFDEAVAAIRGDIPNLNEVKTRLSVAEAQAMSAQSRVSALNEELSHTQTQVVQTAQSTASAISEVREEQRTVFGDVKLAVTTFAKEYEGAREGGASAGREAGTEAAKALLISALTYTGLFAGLPLGGAGLIWIGTKLVARRRRRRASSADDDEDFR